MSVSDETTTVSDGILLSDAAAGKVKALLEQ
ncbi:iron-sulfur cluster insertion protein ErpA, partial [Streptomyces sp. SID7982]|nr:iron-sulfur cluster insertion protein ErpA [Streptomyces sp. SID7982]